MNSPKPVHYTEPLAEEPAKRQLFSTGELLLLAGMILVVMSASMAWQRTESRISLPAIPTYVGRRGSIQLGFDLKLGWIKIGWLIVLAAITATSMVLFDPHPKWRARIRSMTFGSSALILIVAILYFGNFVGPWLCGIGGALIGLGGYFRYR